MNIAATRLLSYGFYPLLAAACCASIGCRQEPPPRFSVGAEVQELTEGLEDEEEIEFYEGLQQEVIERVRSRTGTPDKLLMLGEEQRGPLELGYAVYSRYCTQCHGVDGDGNGPVAEYLNPKPRNYQPGVFKFTSTPYAAKPRRSDLIRTVRRGVTGTSMPSFDRLSDEQVQAAVDYVLALAYRAEFERQLALFAYDEEEMPDEEILEQIVADVLEPWQEASDQLVMPVTPMPPMTEETVEQGHRIFLDRACNKCHGKYGRGGSMGNVEVGTDVWGNEAAAADLSSGMFRGGRRPIDLYRRIYSGINGTPMPAFAAAFQDNPDAIWYLVHFIKATGERRREGLPPLSEADLPEGADAAESDAGQGAGQAATDEDSATTQNDQSESTNEQEKAAADSSAAAAVDDVEDSTESDEPSDAESDDQEDPGAGESASDQSDSGGEDGTEEADEAASDSAEGQTQQEAA